MTVMKCVRIIGAGGGGGGGKKRLEKVKKL
jgi:hypothetical protein